MIFTLNTLKNLLKDAKFYNFPENWSANGLRIWHEDFKPDSIALMREGESTSGILPKRFNEIKDMISAILTTDNIEHYKKTGIPVIEIEDELEVIESLGKYARSKYQGCTIAITGSCGKTTCATIIHDILSEFGADINKNGNTRYGISWNLTCFNLQNKYWIIETSLGGRMLKNAEIVKPHYAIVTNIAAVHLEKNQDTSFIAMRKREIFSSMSKGDIAILYNNMEHFDIIKNAALKQDLEIITYGEKDADININCQTGNNYIEYFGTKYIIKKDYIPKHILLNMAAAFAVVLKENIAPKLAINKFENFELLEGRGKEIHTKISGGREITITNEAYNANPLSMKFALEAFMERFSSNPQKVLILGDMAEGGKYSQEDHLALEGLIRKINPAKIFFCGEKMKLLHEKLNTDYPSFWELNSEKLMNVIIDNLEDKDTVFIKGSHSTRLHKVVNFLKTFDTKEVLTLNAPPPEWELCDLKTKISGLFFIKKGEINFSDITKYLKNTMQTMYISTQRVM